MKIGKKINEVFGHQDNFLTLKCKKKYDSDQLDKTIPLK